MTFPCGETDEIDFFYEGIQIYREKAHIFHIINNYHAYSSKYSNIGIVFWMTKNPSDPCLKCIRVINYLHTIYAHCDQLSEPLWSNKLIKMQMANDRGAEHFVNGHQFVV